MSRQENTEVLVIGAGLAGMSAALEADKAGSEVIIAVSSTLCSGSSFYPGTWGLGMVAPQDEEDKKNFVEVITEVGCGMNDIRLSEVLIDHIGEDIEALEEMGVTFKKPETSAYDETLIPCFDRKYRKWYGYLFETAKPAFKDRIESSAIKVLEHTEIFKIIPFKNHYLALAFWNGEVIGIAAKSVVIATGGIGGLYEHRLNTDDITGAGQAMAFDLGCELVNVEFMQFIPGFIEPSYKTIINERALKLAQILSKDGRIIIDDLEVLDERSGHGPFTTRLPSQKFDIEIFEEYLRTGEDKCVKMQYKVSNMSQEGLMIRDYFKWLKEKKKVDASEDIFILPFMHAANGGIKIDEKAATTVPGIFAAGEVTGGMHGADRIGGLSTANGLVFGKIAGREASKYAKKMDPVAAEEQSINIDSIHIVEGHDAVDEIRKLMYRYGSIIRTEKGLECALEAIDAMEKQIREGEECDLKQGLMVTHSILMAKILLKSMLLRKESRGSHYRKDYPEQSEDYDKALIMFKDEKGEIGYKWR